MLVKRRLLVGSFLGLLSIAGGLVVFKGARALSTQLAMMLLCLTFLVGYFAHSKMTLWNSAVFSFGKKTLAVFLALILLSYLVTGFFLGRNIGNYLAVPAGDSIAYFTQAKIFAEGRLNVPSHEFKDFFQLTYFINDGRFFSKYPPGWPLILSLGVALNLPWVINPVLVWLSLLMIYLLGVRLYDAVTASIATIFAGFSSMMLWGACDYFSEPLALLLSCLFFYAVIRSYESSNLWFSGLAGVSLGLLFLTRPYSAAVLAFPASVYWLVSIKKQRELVWRGTVMILVFLFFFALQLAYNYYQTGSPLLLPMTVFNPFDTLGFGLRHWNPTMEPYYFGPLDALARLRQNFFELNYQVLPLLFLFVFFALIGERKKWEILLFLTGVSIIAFHHLYFGLRTRYYFPGFFVFFLLAGKGVVELDKFLKKHLQIPSAARLRIPLVLFPVLCSLVLTSIPYYLEGVKIRSQLADPFLHVIRQDISNAIIFLKSVPGGPRRIMDYTQNSPGFDDSVLFARDLGERNAVLMAYYPSRRYYRYEFDQDAGQGRLVRLALGALE